MDLKREKIVLTIRKLEITSRDRYRNMFRWFSRNGKKSISIKQFFRSIIQVGAVVIRK